MNKSKMDKSAHEFHRINTLATHISKDDMKMTFGVNNYYQLTIVYAKSYEIISSVTCSELI